MLVVNKRTGQVEEFSTFEHYMDDELREQVAIQISYVELKAYVKRGVNPLFYVRFFNSLVPIFSELIFWFIDNSELVEVVRITLNITFNSVREPITTVISLVSRTSIRIKVSPPNNVI